jgi:hypothetical protein
MLAPLPVPAASGAAARDPMPVPTPSRPLRRWLRELAGAGAVVAAAAVLFCLVYGRTTVEAWQTPITWQGDTLSFLAELKVARLGDIGPLRVEPIAELGAPFEANWNDYPRLNKPVLWALGFLTRPLDLLLANNLLLLFAHLLAAASFYLVGCHLRFRPEWAAAGALVFAFSHFAFCRGSELGHLVLCYYWHLPLCILVTAWGFRSTGLPVGSRRFWVGMVAAAAAGLQSIYYAFLFAQFLIFAAAAQALRGAGWKRVTGPLLLAASILAIVAADAAHVVLYGLDHGPNPTAVQRSVQDIEIYALRPIRLVVPPSGHGLMRWRSPWAEHSRGSLEGENEAAFLGLAGAAALAWLGFSALRSPFLRRPAFPRPAPWAVGWIVLFSIAGGVNAALGLLGFVYLRAANRYSVWILALVLLFLVGRLSRSLRALRRGLGMLAALALAAASIADQVPHVVSRQEVEALAARVRSDRELTHALEASLPARAMLFLLPVMDYPEVPPENGVRDYDPFRLFLHSSRLRFDYGTDKGRPREAWRHRVGRMDPSGMVAELEGIGFDGIVVDRRGYVDRGRALLRGLAAAGRPLTLESAARDLAFVRLHPSPAPRRPGVPVLLGRGWSEDGDPQTPEGVWSSGDAECVLTNDSPRPVVLSLSFGLSARSSRQVTVSRGATVVSSWRVVRPLAVSGLRVPVPPGETRLTFSTDRPPDLPEDRAPASPVAFRVSGLTFEVEPPAGQR